MFKPDIVYIFGKGYSMWRDQELKYSLRSLEKYGVNYGNVYLIGDKPNYLNDKIIHIQSNENNEHFKERKIMEKLLLACNNPEISDNFVMFNDDYFLLKEIDFSNLPYYYSDNLENKAEKRRYRDIYYKALLNTDKALKTKGYNTLHFDIHYPMYYNKQKFKEVMASYDWGIPFGYVIKSLYANSINVEGKVRDDVKIYLSYSREEITNKIKNTDLFSTDMITRVLATILQELYSEQSTFEKQ